MKGSKKDQSPVSLAGAGLWPKKLRLYAFTFLAILATVLARVVI
jgi:hypothetical protein